MSLWRGFKALALGIAIYIAVALMLFSVGALEFTLPQPPAPPGDGNPFSWIAYFFALIAYPFQVLFAIIWYGLQIAFLPGAPFPLNVIIGAIIIVLIIYGVIEIVLAILNSIPSIGLPIPV